MHHDSVADPIKRRTLKGAAAIGAASLLPALPAAAGLFEAPLASGMPVSPIDIDAVLISSPDVVEDTLLLSNHTTRDITIERFHANRLVFDGRIVDGNGACHAGPITVAAGKETAFQVIPPTSDRLSSPARECLDVHAVGDRLPNGTRVIPLIARMRGNAAVLMQAI